MVKTESMVKVLLTAEEYSSLLGTFSQIELMELCSINSKDRQDKECWDAHRIDYNTLIALRRAEPIEIEIDLYEHD